MQIPSKEELLNSIQPDMKLTKDFLKRIYGYEISYPGFADQAIAALEVVGCSKARQYYTDWVNEYQTARDAELKEVSHRYRLECEREWKKEQKVGEERRKQDFYRKDVKKDIAGRKREDYRFTGLPQDW